MNIAKLKEAEQKFFETYPGGMENPELVKIIKKHNLKPRMDFCQTSFALNQFSNPLQIVDNMVKAVSRSTMVSLFEKPKFRDFVNSFDVPQTLMLSESLRAMLHGDQRTGFDQMVELLAVQKLAKWTLITVIPAYFNPDYEVFIKPTTVKNILEYMEINDIQYKPAPTYDFYDKYRAYINEMKKYVHKSLRNSNAQFSGFLMMTV
ncbi:MAG: hypothetical protein K9M99_06130 [Candidatus Cloacimonetes bacterium]|nr:hypothetical protein [Candidatus Cloacimonadota bacterium]